MLHSIRPRAGFRVRSPKRFRGIALLGFCCAIAIRHTAWRVQQARRRNGHHGSPHCSAVTVAESLCREAHRLDPSGVFGPPHHLQRTPFAPRPFFLRGLLPPNPNTSIAGKRLSRASPGPPAHTWESDRHSAGWWSAPSLRTPRRLTRLDKLSCRKGRRCGSFSRSIGTLNPWPRRSPSGHCHINSSGLRLRGSPT